MRFNYFQFKSLISFKKAKNEAFIYPSFVSYKVNFSL